MSGTPEIEEVKRVTELKSRLRAVSEAAGRWGGGESGPAGLPSEPRAEDPSGVCLFFCPPVGRGPLQMLPQDHRDPVAPEQPEF